MEQDVDIRSLLISIVRRWRLLAIVFIGITVALMWWLARVPQYKAEAHVSFSQFQVSADFQSGIQASELPTDMIVFGNTLVNLSKSSLVVQDIISRSGDSLPPTLRDPFALQSIMDVRLDARSNTVILNVLYSDPEVAKSVANGWADALAVQANRIYGGSFGSNLSLQTVNMQYAAARSQYEQSEKALLDFVASNNVEVLDQRVEEYEMLIENLRGARTDVISATAGVDVFKATEVISAYADLRWGARAAAIDQQVEQQVETLITMHERERRLGQLRNDAQALRDHLSGGGEPESARIALQLLKAQVFAGSSELPAELQINASDGGLPTVADVDSVLTVINQQLDRLREDIALLSTRMLDGSTVAQPPAVEPLSPDEVAAVQQQLNDLLSGGVLPQVAGVSAVHDTEALSDTVPPIIPDDAIVLAQQRLQQLKAQSLSLRARQFILEQERDLAEKVYVALGLKRSEIISVSENDAIQVISPAVFAQRQSLSTALLRALFVALSVTLTIALILVIRDMGPRWFTEAPAERLNV